jgi:hypothetical protein
MIPMANVRTMEKRWFLLLLGLESELICCPTLGIFTDSDVDKGSQGFQLVVDQLVFFN